MDSALVASWLSSDPALSPHLILVFRLKQWRYSLLFLLLALGPGPLLSISIFDLGGLAGLVFEVLTDAVLEVVLELAGELVAVLECLRALSLHLALLELALVHGAVLAR